MTTVFGLLRFASLAGNAESEADKFARDRRTEQNACISPSTMTLPMAQSSISKKYLSERQGSPPPQKARGAFVICALSSQTFTLILQINR
jgi:hypothetical protein